MHHKRLAAVAVAVALFTASLAQAGWTRFRGPNGSGVSEEKQSLPEKFSPTENLKWKIELPGPGSSSPIVVGDRVIVTCWSGYGESTRNPGDQKDLRRHVVCVDRNSGDLLWKQTVEPYLPEDRYGGQFAQHGYASHTPTADDQRVYVFFGKTGVLALDLNDGKQLWKTSVGTESGSRNWGTASSPLLYKNLVIVPATAESQSLVALNKETGEQVWKAEAGGFSSTWGTPVLVKVDDERTDLVLAVPFEIWGFNPDTGKLLWYCEAIGSSSMCSSVVAHDGVVYGVESGPGGGGGVAVKAGGKGDVSKSHVVWTSGDRSRIGTPLYYDGRIYFAAGGVVNCVNARDGERIYQARLNGGSARGGGGFGGRGGQDYASPVAGDGKLYFTSRSGTISVVKLGDKFEQIAANRLTTDSEDFSATPAISDGALFIRSSKHLYCVAEKADE